MSDSFLAGFGADAIVVGAGLAGLVAACELVDRGLRVLSVLDEGRAPDGTAIAKLPGISIDNALYNEVHANTDHGYALPDRDIYNKVATMRDWELILAMFRRQLSCALED